MFFTGKKPEPIVPDFSFRIYKNGHGKYSARMSREDSDMWFNIESLESNSEEQIKARIEEYVQNRRKDRKVLIATITYA